MGLINREATFKCKIVDHGLSRSSNSWPQWVAQLQAFEIYDEDEKVWVDWTDQEENQISTYMVLVGSKGETLGVSQLVAATGWDGSSFIELGGLDLSEVTVQARVELHSYNGKESYQVSWLDAGDATPGRSVKKLDAGGMKALEAEFKQFLTASKAPAKVTKPTEAEFKQFLAASKAPAKVTKPTKAPARPRKRKAPVTTVEESVLDLDVTLMAPPDGPVEPPLLATPPDPSLPTGKSTKQEAWDTVVSLKRADISDSEFSTIWVAAVEAIGKKNQKLLTEEDWFTVREDVLGQTAKF